MLLIAILSLKQILLLHDLLRLLHLLDSFLLGLDRSNHRIYVLRNVPLLLLEFGLLEKIHLIHTPINSSLLRT